VHKPERIPFKLSIQPFAKATISCNCFGNDYIFVVLVCERPPADAGSVYRMIKHRVILSSKANFIVKNGSPDA
jgi:hypothetical protein